MSSIGRSVGNEYEQVDDDVSKLARDSISRRNLTLSLLGITGAAGLASCAYQADQAQLEDVPDVEGAAEALTGTNFRWVTAIGTAAAPLDLRALSTAGLIADQVVVATGFTAHGDGGGGAFFWDATSTATDDGGLVIRPASNPATGRWRRLLYDSQLNVKWFGAVGNGIADDGAAIQAALNAAASLSTKSTNVHLPAGVYKVTQSLGVTAATGIVVSGAGMGEITLSGNPPVATWKGGTVIWDSQITARGATGAYSGLISFVSCSECGVRDLTLHGAYTAFNGTPSAAGTRKATYFSLSRKCVVERVRATEFQDEAIYAEGDSPGWLVSHCIVERTNLSGINLNAGGNQAEGAIVTANHVTHTWGNCILVGSRSAAISNNVVRIAPGTPVGADLIAVDSSGRTVITNNVLYDSDTSSAGVSGIVAFGSNLQGCSLLIANNILISIKSNWVDGVGAGIRVSNTGVSGDMVGTTLVVNNIIDDCGTVGGTSGGRAISVNHPSTGKVYVAGNSIRNRVGKNVTVGINVFSDVSTGAVTIGRNSYENIQNPYVLGSPSALDGYRRIVSTAGVQPPLAAFEEDIFVTATGPVTLTLPNASLYSNGQKRIMIKNTSTRTGTTTVNSAGGSIDGSVSVTLVNANVGHTYQSDGTNWHLVAKV
jgi:hypothetical protein